MILQENVVIGNGGREWIIWSLLIDFGLGRNQLLLKMHRKK